MSNISTNNQHRHLCNHYHTQPQQFNYISQRQQSQQQQQQWQWYASEIRPKIVQVTEHSVSSALAEDGYYIGSTIGQGSYSKVKMALKLQPDRTMKRVACKLIDKRRASNGSYIRKFLPRELEVLRIVRHPNIVNTHKIFITPSSVYVFMDYCEKGDLLNYIQKTRGLPQWQAHSFFKQLCGAVDYLHRNDISHRDIKCENVLLESLRHIKLTDFGFTRFCVDERSRQVLSQTYCGSSSYAAPEVLQGIPYNPKLYDVWALGVVLYIMLGNVMPYPHSDRSKIVANQLAKKLYQPRKLIPREALKLIGNILEPDVKKRAVLGQIMNHTWYKQNPLHITKEEFNNVKQHNV
ncbi:testis-specific serine/threonine-protein kinase 1-like [Daktulosphaira vitifoliae]|uniref:testis-specific serine/threonine-protein kinase 1-like n=1 Tax=Daktulosphaira vitifoliae TaxID=58002 RepID=UPI0021A9DC50|nr:testis-specific serine/threonine-protein kinase 1-like [Daktulosphaira vitifoliae]